jgi:hypothetical protein
MPPDDFAKKLTEALTRSLKGVSNVADPETIQEEEDLEKEHAKAILRGLTQDIDERKKYAKCFFIPACCWLVAITGLLLLQGFGAFWFGRMPFKLADRAVSGHWFDHRECPGHPLRRGDLSLSQKASIATWRG